MVTIPFDLETAKKINIGERVGQIVTEKGRNRAEIVYEDNSSICPLLVVIHSISVSADWFSATGKAFSSENRLLLEVPEYTTFKDGDVLSSKDGSYIFILNTHGKYLTSFYASLAAGKSLNISDNLAAHENHIECYRLATDSEKQKMIKALKKSKNPKAKEYPLFKAGAEWRINSVWHSITVIPDCHRFIVFLPKKSTIGSKSPIMGILEENKTFISSRPGCILYRLDEMESWAYLDDLLP